MKNKKGFTLIEIIIAIALLALISVGSIVGVNKIKSVSLDKERKKVYSKFDDALNVYLSDHSEIYKNLSENVEGVVVTLETLKNEGLVDDNIIDPETDEKIDYSNNYYVLSDAVLLENETETTDVCDGQVELNVIKSWESLKDKVDTSDIIYICPREDKEENDEELEQKLTEYENRIKVLEESIKLLDIGSKYVVFDVSSDDSKIAYWPNNENQDLWRVFSQKNGKIKLLYTQSVKANNNMYFSNEGILTKIDKCTKNNLYNFAAEDYYSINLNMGVCSSKGYDGSSYFYKNELHRRGWYTYYSNDGASTEKKCDGNNITVYERPARSDYLSPAGLSQYSFLNESYRKRETSKYPTNVNYDYIKYSSNDEWSAFDIFDSSTDSTNSKKQVLFSKINNNLKNYISKENYYYSYTVAFNSDMVDIKFDPTVHYNDKLGIITYNEVQSLLTEDPSVLMGTRFALGIVNGTLRLSDTVTAIFYVSNGIYEYPSPHILTTGNCYDSQYKTTAYTLNTVPYYPVITVGGKLLVNYDDYPNTYKTRYTSCNQDLLGTKDCPYLIKFDNYYSDGSAV